MQQPTLAPAPQPVHQHQIPATPQVQPSYLNDEEAQTLIEDWAKQGDGVSEVLRVSLLQEMSQGSNTDPKQAPQASPLDQAGSRPPHDENLNIDPGLAGVGVHTGPQQMPTMPQHIQQHPQHVQQRQHAPHAQMQQQPVPPMQGQMVQQQQQVPQQVPQQQQHLQQMQQQPQQQMAQVMPQANSQQPQQVQLPVHVTDSSPEVAHGSDNDQSAEAPRRGGKRELSTSKRAAQNRAAQRAFRQRKEGYIKKLEEQVRDFNALEESYKAIQNENYQLRDYIISLQSRLIESQGEDAVPPAPILITHQLPHQTAQQALPSHLLPPPQAQIQQVQGQGQGQGQQVHAPPPAAPTAPMGGSGQGPPTPQMAPQAPMMAAPQAQMMQSAPQAPMMSTPQAPVQQTQQQQQPQPQTQQLVVDNGNAAAKRAFEDDAAFNGYVAKKLRGEAVDATPQQQPSTIPVELRDPKGTA